MSGGDDGSGFAALEASRADRAPDGRQDASGLAQQLAAYATEQFMAGLRYLLEAISRQAGTDLEFSQ